MSAALYTGVGHARTTFLTHAGAAGVGEPPPGALEDYARRLLDTELPAALAAAEAAGDTARVMAIKAMTRAAEALLEHVDAEHERRRRRPVAEQPPPPRQRTCALAVDPGAAHTGVVLARVLWGADGVTLRPVDGLTIDRSTSGSERVGLHSAPAVYGLRVVHEISAMLACRDAEPWIICVESVLPPTPVRSSRRPPRGAVSARVAGHVVDLAVVAGVLVGTWPGAHLVAPANADHAGDWPLELRGRRPAGWTPTGSARQHQRAAWSVLRSGLEGWLDDRSRRVAIAVETQGGSRSLGVLLDAAREAAGDAAPAGTVIELGARAAALIEPATDLTAMRRRLHDRVRTSAA